jgi:hypothetical protein
LERTRRQALPMRWFTRCTTTKVRESVLVAVRSLLHFLVQRFHVLKLVRIFLFPVTLTTRAPRIHAGLGGGTGSGSITGGLSGSGGKLPQHAPGAWGRSGNR